MIEQLELDWCQAHINRDNGIKVAVLNADSHSEKWSEDALFWLKQYIKSHDRPFQAEEVRVFAHSNGLKPPPSARAWGGVILKAASLDLIKKIDIKATSGTTAHSCFASVWEKT
jgi:hypothetical protein